MEIYLTKNNNTGGVLKNILENPMDVYLAGVGPCIGTGGVLLEAQRRNMNVYLAGAESRTWCIDEYLSGRGRPLEVRNNRISGGGKQYGQKSPYP